MRALGLIACLLVGAFVGVVGAFVQAARFLLAGITVPWGLALMLVVLLVLIRCAIELTEGRWGGWCLLAGWIAVTIVFAAELPSGALIISAGDRQMAYLLGGVVVGATAATIPPIARLRRS